MTRIDSVPAAADQPSAPAVTVIVATFDRSNIVGDVIRSVMLIVVPPDVWHGVKNIGARTGALLKLPDRAHAYEAPDHWRLPWDTDRIRYSFAANGAMPSGNLERI